MSIAAFRKTIYAHFKKHRRDFPWRRTKNPYRIMISEIMLQQTQASRVVQKYKLFIKEFPTVRSLATSRLSRVLRVWQGLGYNRRALYVRRSAKRIVKEHAGIIPRTVEELSKLPGIGYASACAICAFAYNKPVIFIETNIRSVFLHFFFKGKKNVKDSDVLVSVRKALDRAHPREWYFALMDYGVMLKAKYGNPNTRSAHHARQSPFKDSDRYIRGAIMRLVTDHSFSEDEITEQFNLSKRRRMAIFKKLMQEGLIEKRGATYAVARG